MVQRVALDGAPERDDKGLVANSPLMLSRIPGQLRLDTCAVSHLAGLVCLLVMIILTGVVTLLYVDITANKFPLETALLSLGADDTSLSALMSVGLANYNAKPAKMSAEIGARSKFHHFEDIDEIEKLMLPIRQNGTLPCHNIRTETAQVLGLPMGNVQQQEQDERSIIRLEAGIVHEILIVSLGDDGKPRCTGGDYYETDLSGPRWKSRPPIVDHNNGTYSIELQVDPRFIGVYVFKVVLLFSNFHGLDYHPQNKVRLEEVASYRIEFFDQSSTSKTTRDCGRSSKFKPMLLGYNPGVSFDSVFAPARHPSKERGQVGLHRCKPQDFKRKAWSGRWTREEFHEDCEYDSYGRWQCVDADLQCQRPWCEGPVGRLESNGWVYSAHCAFKVFQMEEAWKCLDGKWLFFWGDSNHMDTIRNLLNFVLGFDQQIKFVDRRMDSTFSNPVNNRSSVHITSMFNGHANVTMNFQGLFSLRDQAFAEQLRSYFAGDVAPDVMIMNSGVHDGTYWKDPDKFLKQGAEFAAEFWAEIWNNMTARRPDILYRTTVAAAGLARSYGYNPHKMEVFNQLMVETLLKLKLERFSVIDGFDYTFPWHWDHQASDGPHYGRPPSKTKWAGNNVGHKYFVDLMLVHMLLNALCAPEV